MDDTYDFCEDVDDIKKALENNRNALAAQKAQEILEKQKNVPLTIGITGESGSGKSSLVNALRGIEDDDERAAPTGSVETTMEPTEYTHPKHPNIKICDLPGIGTTKIPADKYLKHVRFERFDFFIIICDTRFRENDAKLAQEIQKMKKKFYFVRSKIDDNMRAEKRKKKREFNEKNTLKQIRDNCIQELKKLKIESPKVFLVSSFELHLYDFQTLYDNLERDLPQHQRDVLLLALPNISLEIINKKKLALQAKIKYYAVASAFVAGVPVVGLSASVDFAMTVDFITECQVALGLDNVSLQHLSKVSKKPLKALKEELKSPLAGVAVTKELLAEVLSMSVTYITATAVEEGARFIPFFGIPLAASISFGTTYQSLSYLLNTLADDAQRVFMKALGLNTSV